MKSFWTLNTLDKCKALAQLIRTISAEGFTSIDQLSSARGETAESVWLHCCLEARVEPCEMPLQLFGGHREVSGSLDLPLDATGVIAQANILSSRIRPSPFSFLRRR